jgi:predicted DNA-binding transcriptional regulator YafY
MAKFKPQYRRLLYIDRKIREGRFPNCSSLAEAWETSTRTILRDLEYLKDELGAPIEYEPIKRGFFYSDPSWFLPSVMLSEGDLLALLIGQQALTMYRGTPMAGELERIFGKLAELLPDKIAIGPEFMQARVSFFNPPSRPIDPETWRVVLRALMHLHGAGDRLPVARLAQAQAASGPALPHRQPGG